MAYNQILVPNLNIIVDALMSEHRLGAEDVHQEPSTGTVVNAEQETQSEIEGPVEEERAAKRQRVVERTEEG